MRATCTISGTACTRTTWAPPSTAAVTAAAGAQSRPARRTPPTAAGGRVVVRPFYARPGTFETPATSDVGRIFAAARRRLPGRPVNLGCARPAGMHRRVTDAYAIMAGLDGIAYPADGAVAVARAIGRPFEQAHACCAIKVGAGREAGFAAPCAV